MAAMNELRDRILPSGDSTVAKWFSDRKSIVGILFGCLLFFLLLALVIFTASTKDPHTEPQILHAERKVLPETTNICLNRQCIDQAALMLQMRNASADPCENFYNYACGGFTMMAREYGALRWIPEDIDELLYVENTRDIIGALSTLPDDAQPEHSAIEKAAKIYRSCHQTLFNTTTSPKKLIDILENLTVEGLFGQWNENSYDLTDDFANIIVDHWTDNMFQLKATNVSSGPMFTFGKGLFNFGVWMLEKHEYEAEKFYEMTMREILRRLLSSNETEPTASIDKFIQSVIRVEKLLIHDSNNMHVHSEVGMKYTTLKKLKTFNKKIDWRKFFGKFVDENSIDENLQIKLDDATYFAKVEKVIDETSPSEIHNYLVWGVIQKYLPSLGLFYSTPLITLLEVMGQSSNGMSNKAICKELVNEAMPLVLDLMFGLKYGNEPTLLSLETFLEKQKHSAIKLIKKQSKDGDNGTVVDEIKQIKLGHNFLPRLSDESIVDGFYSKLSINSDEMFEITKAIGRFHRNTLSDVIAKKEFIPGDAVSWKTKLVSDKRRQSISVPFGSAKPPFYGVDLPNYINSAALGTKVLEAIQSFVINPDGENLYHFAKFGHKAQKELFHYTSCLSEKYKRFKSDLFSFVSEADLVEAGYSINSALDLSYENMKKFMVKESNPEIFPGLTDMTPQQLFFLAFTQARCDAFVTNLDQVDDWMRNHFYVPQIIRVNTALYNNKEFRKAFKCSNIPEVYNTEPCVLPAMS